MAGVYIVMIGSGVGDNVLILPGTYGGWHVHVEWWVGDSN